MVARAGVHIGLKLAEQRLDVHFIDEDHVVHGRKRSNKDGTRAFRENRPAFAVQPSRTGIRVDSHDEPVSLSSRRGQIANVARVQHIEDAVSENDSTPCSAVLFKHFVQTATGEDLFARVHSE